MTADDQLQYESRVRTRQATIAGVAGVCIVLATVLQLAGPHPKVDELTLALIYAHKRFPLDVIGAIVNALGYVGIALTLVFLVRISRARNPQVGTWIWIVGAIGAALAAISAIAYAALIAGKASDFVSHGNQTYQQAHQLTSGTALAVLPLIGQLAALLIAIAIVMASLQAMRVGLLTKFMGYLGIIAGVLVMFPIGAVATLIQGFWLLALGYLISGRWPNGVPPAWRTGQAEAWPTAADVREQRMRARGTGGRSGRLSAPTPAPETVGAQAPRTRATTAKRKRKKRR
jgi:hypothetical protein